MRAEFRCSKTEKPPENNGFSGGRFSKERGAVQPQQAGPARLPGPVLARSAARPARSPSSCFVLSQHREHFRIVERVAPASHERQQFSIGSEPFQRRCRSAGRSAARGRARSLAALDLLIALFEPRLGLFERVGHPPFGLRCRHGLQEPSPLRFAVDDLPVNAADTCFSVDHNIVVFRPLMRIVPRVVPPDAGVLAHLAQDECQPVRPRAHGWRRWPLAGGSVVHAE